MSDTDWRDRLLDRCGLPRDCGWTDDMLFEHIDLGLRTNCRTEPAENTAEGRRRARVADLAWALNVHSLDALAGIPDDKLAELLLDVVTSLSRAHLVALPRASASITTDEQETSSDQ